MSVTVSDMEAWLPLLCLAAVFLHHRWRMYSMMQSAWKGGGFAMFSDIQRNVVVADVWLQENGHVTGPFRVTGHRLLLEAAVVPTPERLERCGRELLSCRWNRSEDTAWVVQRGSSTRSWRATKTLLRHLRMDFDAADGRYSSVESLACVVGGDPDGCANVEHR
jgi:hypothetical protein